MNHHFNWDKLMQGREVEDFLAADDLWGEHQDADNPGRQRWREHLQGRLQAGTPLRVLEVGFGSGIDYGGLEQAGLLAAPNLDYFGVDVTRKFVEHAHRRFARMKPFLIDGFRLPFADQTFDIVYMRHVLEHQTHYEQLLAEIFRVCRGEVFVIFFIPLSEADADDIQFDGTWHNNRYARRPFNAFARRHGFDPEVIAAFHYTSGYTDDELILCRRRGAPQPKIERPAQSHDSASRPLTIAFGSQHYPAAGQPTEGIGAYVVTAARGLAARGHRVHIVTCAHPGRPADWTEAGVAIHQIGLPGPNAKDPAQVQQYSRAVAERIQALDAVHHFDVVEFQEWAAEGWAYAARPDQLLVVRTQTPSWVVREFEYAEGTAAERQIDELERWPLERADLVTAPSRLAARRLAERWAVDASAAVIIPNGVDGDEFKPPAPRPPAAEPLVLCVNRYTPLKGVEQFVRAAAIVHRQFPSARFRLVGRNGDWNGQPADQYLRQLALSLGLPADRIAIPGPLPREALAAEYAAADVGVNPSLYENVSHTALELLACGRPAILTSGQGNTEYMTAGEDCLIVPPGDVEHLADAMLTLLRDPELAERLGRAARRTVEAKLSATAVAGQLETAYRQGLARLAGRAAVRPARLNLAILTHNALEYTQNCLGSLIRHTPEPFNIFVVDNASDDGTPAWLAAQSHPGLHLVLSLDNLGVAGGRNRLIREILPHLPEDGFIIFLDNDVEVSAGWCDPFLQAFGWQAEAGVVGAAGHPILVHAETRELLPAPAEGPTPVDVVSGFCFWVKAETARAVGLFDERLGRFWHEDDDYCVRAIGLGYEVYAVPGAPLVHHAHKSGVADPDIAQGGSLANQRYLADKWRQLGWVASDGCIVRLAPADPNLKVRERLGRMLNLGQPLTAEALGQTADFFAALLSAPDILGFAEAHRAALTPAFFALLTLNIEQARQDGNGPLAQTLENLGAVLADMAHADVAESPNGPAALPGPGAPQPPEAALSLSADDLLKRRLTIGVDARTLLFPSSVARGIGHYTYYHLNALMAAAPHWKFILFVDDVEKAGQADHLGRLAQLPNAEVRSLLDAAEPLDLFHVPDPVSMLPGFDSPFRLLPGVPTSVVFYDLIPLIFRGEYFDRWDAGSQSAFLARLEQIKASEGCLLAISENTRRDVHTQLGLPLDRITAIMGGLNRSAEAGPRPPARVESTLAKYGLQRPFFLTVGSLDPHKNFGATARAFKRAQAKVTAQLAVVGSLEDPFKPLYRAALEEKGITGVVFTGFVARDELEDLYAAATALVFPSKYEGFGFPVLEAMARGCPVIASNAASIPEVAGEAAVLASPDDVVQIAAAMVALAKEPRLRQELKAKGPAQAEKFTWEATAQKTFAAWAEFLGQRPQRAPVARLAGQAEAEGRPAVAARRPASRPCPGFNVIGHVSGNLGLGVLARNVVRLLTERGCPVAIADMDPALGRGGHDRTFERLVVGSVDQLEHEINLYVLPPPTLAWLFLQHPEVLAGGRLQAALPMWELAVLPAAWVEGLRPLDVVVAHTHFIQHTFASQLSHVLTTFAPPLLYLPTDIRPSRARFGLPEGDVLFVTSFEPHSDMQRKNPFAALEAFEQALGRDPHAHLVVKLNNANCGGGAAQPAVARLQRECEAHPRMHLIQETLSYAEALSLYAACDVYVSLHRAEGLGLGPMEAMTFGKPVIATAWSGNMTFMKHTNSCPVGFRLIPVEGTIPAYQQEFLGGPALWADPSVEEAAAWMERLAGDPALRAEIGGQAAADMAALQGEARRGQFVDELAAICEQRGVGKAGGGGPRRAVVMQRAQPNSPHRPDSPTLGQGTEGGPVGPGWAVDIVVPIYGQPDLLRRCVESTLATTANAHLILVDDCSPGNEIQQLFAGWKGNPRLTLARTPENQGFIGAGRLGASLGEAPFVLFLNSDTEAVEPGWLERLMPAQADVAITGAQLLYPRDVPGPLAGTLQHVGVARNSDGIPYHPLLGRPADTPEANVRREVNAVTGACLLIRRQVWDELGGWDARFGKGVYEDVDLCWQARRKGYRILYQPDARLIHHESASKAPDGRHTLNEHTQANREMLLEKWRPVSSDEALFFGEKTARRWERARKQLRRAQAALETGNAAAATAAARKAVEAGPDLAEARIAYAQVLAAQSDPAAAAEHLAEAVRLAPAAWDARLRLVDALAAAGQPDEARAELEALAAAFPHAPEVQQRAAALALPAPGDAPPERLYPAERLNTPGLNRAADTLRTLLEADDLPAALQQNAARLDSDFVALVRLNAEAARADGNPELAEGLEELAAYVGQAA